MTALPQADHQTLHGLIGELAHAEPTRTALREGDVVMTFGGLWERAGQVTSLLLQRGVKPGEVVAVALPRSIDLVVACLATLRAGGVVLGLDLRLPAVRNAKAVFVAKAAWSITRGKTNPECVAATSSLDIEDATSGAEIIEMPVDPESAAFLVFTSGSTGEPKGVVLSHRAMVARAHAERAVYLSDPSDVCLFLTSPAFIAMPVLLAYMATGAALLLIGEDVPQDAPALAAAIREGRATHAGLPPRLLETLISLPDAAARLSSLRVIASITEAIPLGVAARCRELLPQCRLLDRYGATETSGIVAMADLRESRGLHSGESALDPLPGVVIELVDEEIRVSSALLASGYLSGDDADDPKFVRRSNAHETSPRLWYRTGDRGRLTPDGRLVVLGRLDLQLNVDGVRVDPGEVENALRLHPAIADAAVWTHPDATGRSRLVAYLVDREAPASAATLRSFLALSLPQALVPARFVRLAALPLAPSGKVNRAALPRPEIRPRAPLAARNETESKVLRIFEETLGVEGLGLNDDFFEWGGDSLKAFDLMTKIFEATGVKLPGATILNAPTVEDLAREVARGDPGQVITVWLRKTGDLPPLVCLPGLAADPLWMFPLIAALDPGQPLLGLSFVGLKPPITIKGAAARGLEELRVVQPRGPYFLLGHSLGGVLAFEMARELIGSGEEVAFVGLLDTFVPGSPKTRSMAPSPNLARRFRRWKNRIVPETKERLRGLLLLFGVLKKRAVPLFLPGFRAAVQSHRILPCDLAVTLFRASQRSAASDLASEWAPLARRGVEVIDVPGDHLNLLTGGRANELSVRIAAAVHRAAERKA